MKSKILYKIFLYISVIASIICSCIILNNTKIEHMGIKYSAKNIKNTKALSKITNNLFIKPADNIKIYDVSSKKLRNKLKKENIVIYNRYIMNLKKLNLNDGQLISYIDTRSNK
jgi:hypothetical protein